MVDWKAKARVALAAGLLVGTAGCTSLSTGGAGLPPHAASIHVNQVALERTGPKVAVVELPDDMTAASFRLVQGGQMLMQGDLEPLPGFSEWGAGRHYYRADFAAFTGTGTVMLEIDTATGTLRSAPIEIGDAALLTKTAAALVSYFRENRYTNPADHHIRIFGTDRFVDVWGGWKDAGGDNGKYLSHLSYANFFNPQQSALVPWAMARAYEKAGDRFRKAGLADDLLAEIMWGADYLTRNIDADGSFYMTVFDKWGTDGAERVVTGYVGLEGTYTTDYRAAFREGAGMAIAALARAARLSKETGVAGAVPAGTYLADAERGFAHLQAVGAAYCDDGRENIIDDYTAAIAATELYLSTGKPAYLEAARTRADNLLARVSADGWWISDDGGRPFYHGADAGMPVVALVAYAGVETDVGRIAAVKAAIARVLDHQLALDAAVANPFDYARQEFRLYDFDKKELAPGVKAGFFLPHANETGYWWQGESARLASLATAAIEGGQLIAPQAGAAFGVEPKLAAFAQHQIDWILGRNPYDISMLYGFGTRNPPYAESGGDMVKGGISNGITGTPDSAEGRGIGFAVGPDSENWRWVEQWIPHAAWFILAASSMSE